MTRLIDVDDWLAFTTDKTRINSAALVSTAVATALNKWALNKQKILSRQSLANSKKAGLKKPLPEESIRDDDRSSVGSQEEDEDEVHPANHVYFPVAFKFCY